MLNYYRRAIARLHSLGGDAGQAVLRTVLAVSVIGAGVLGVGMAAGASEPEGADALIAEGETQVETFVEILTGPLGLAVIGLAVVSTVLAIVLRRVRAARSQA